MSPHTTARMVHDLAGLMEPEPMEMDDEQLAARVSEILGYPCRVQVDVSTVFESGQRLLRSIDVSATPLDGHDCRTDPMSRGLAVFKLACESIDGTDVTVRCG